MKNDEIIRSVLLSLEEIFQVSDFISDIAVFENTVQIDLIDEDYDSDKEYTSYVFSYEEVLNGSIKDVITRVRRESRKLKEQREEYERKKKEVELKKRRKKEDLKKLKELMKKYKGEF